MKTLERTLFVLFIYTVIQRCFDSSAGEGMILISGTVLSIFYLLFGFAVFNGIFFQNLLKKSAYADISAKRIIAGIGTGIVLSTIVVAAVFKFLILSGEREMMLLGLSAMIIIIIAAITLKRSSSPVIDQTESSALQRDAFYRGVFVRGGIALMIGTSLLFVSKLSLLRIYFKGDPQKIENVLRERENTQ